jgi:hypothetical protein
MRQSSIRAAIVVFIGAAVFTASSAQQPTAHNPFAGSWTYRSFRNEPTPVGDVDKDPSKLVKLLFAEAEWVVADEKDNVFKGELRFGPNEVMDLLGTFESSTSLRAAHVHINGRGRPNTPTSQLFYDYDGWLVPMWPNGVNQRQAIVGSVIRVKPHDNAPAGYVASFIAVKRD